MASLKSLLAIGPWTMQYQVVLGVEMQLALEVVNTYETQFWGKTVELESYSTAEDKILPATHTHRCSFSADGVFSRWLSRFDMRQLRTTSGTLNYGFAVTECCLIPGQRLRAKTNAEVPPEMREQVSEGVRLSGYFNCPLGLFDSLGSPGVVFGIAPSDGIALSKILAESRLQLKRQSLDDNKCVLLEGVHPDRGNYQIWITEVQPHRMIKVQIEKGPGRIVSHGCEAPEVRMTIPMDQMQEAFTETTIIEPSYQLDMDKSPQLTSVTMHRTVTHRNGHRIFDMKDFYVVRAVSDFHIKDTTRMAFETVAVEDGMPVSVHGQENVRYEFRKGRIERVIDTEAIVEMDGVRFRKPPPEPWWRRGLPVAVLVFGVIWMVVRYRRGAS